MHKIIKASRQTVINAFRPHYFPDIAVGGSLEKRQTTGGDTVFKTEDFFNGAAAPVDSPVVQIEDDKPAPEPGPDLEELAKEAYARGFENGEQDGRTSALQRIEPVVETLKNTIEAFNNVRYEMGRTAEKASVELALAIGRKIIGHELRVHREAVIHVVAAALEKVLDHGSVKVKVNPKDFEAVSASGIDLSQFVENSDDIGFEPCKTISPGGCLVETDFGDIDARIETQIKAVETELKSKLISSMAEG